MSSWKEQVLGVPAVRERSLLKNVYLWMTAGLALTGIVALFIASRPSLVMTLVRNPALFFGLIVAEFLLVFFLSSRIQSLSPGAATLGFAVYAILNGITLSLIFLAYTGSSIARVFFITAGAFGGMSLYALTTKKSLAGMGTYLMMGLWGIILATVVNLFVRSSGLDWIISYAGVALFLGLTAYDTQIIQSWNARMGSQAEESEFIRVSILGALKLYLDFINLFLFFLRIFGRRN